MGFIKALFNPISLYKLASNEDMFLLSALGGQDPSSLLGVGIEPGKMLLDGIDPAK